MFLHEFGEDLVLALELLLQKGDPPVLGIAGVSGTGLEHGRGVFEELLLPAVEHRGVDAVPVTQVRDRGVFEEVKPQNGHLLLRREGRPSFLGHVRTDSASLTFFRQRIADCLSPRTDSASLRLVAEATAVRDPWALVRSRGSAGGVRETLPVAPRETA